MKTATRATYGCSRKSVIVDLSCGLGYTPALSVTHSTAKVALQLVALYKYRAFFNAHLHVTWLRWCSWHYHCLFYFFDSDSDSVRCLPPTCVDFPKKPANVIIEMGVLIHCLAICRFHGVCVANVLGFSLLYGAESNCCFTFFSDA